MLAGQWPQLVRPRPRPDGSNSDRGVDQSTHPPHRAQGRTGSHRQPHPRPQPGPYSLVGQRIAAGPRPRPDGSNSDRGVDQSTHPPHRAQGRTGSHRPTFHQARDRVPNGRGRVVEHLASRRLDVLAHHVPAGNSVNRTRLASSAPVPATPTFHQARDRVPNGRGRVVEHLASRRLDVLAHHVQDPRCPCSHGPARVAGLKDVQRADLRAAAHSSGTSPTSTGPRNRPNPPKPANLQDPRCPCSHGPARVAGLKDVQRADLRAAAHSSGRIRVHGSAEPGCRKCSSERISVVGEFLNPRALRLVDDADEAVE